MDLSLVKIRLQQISQESGGLGPIHLIIIAGVLAWVEYSLFLTYSSLQTALISFGILSFLLLSAHLARPDARFLWQQLPQPSAKLFAEYYLFSLPFVLPAIASWQFWLLALHALCCWGLSKWPYYRKGKFWYFPWLSNWISVRKQLEWLTGIRRYWWVLLPLYLLTWAFCWLRAFPIIGLWFFTLFIANFYNEGEPLNILRIQMDRPATFLRKKIFSAFGLMLLLYAPQLLINAIIHNDIWYFHLIFLCMQLIALLFIILSKYAIYEPNAKLKGNSVLQAFALMGTVIQYLAPLPIFLCFWYYPRAIRQLKKYKSTL
jgi:hypothetical protein